MTDLQAAIGLIELGRYEENLKRRKQIFDQYHNAFISEDWAINPPYETNAKTSSYHLYLLRINGATELQRDEIIKEIFEQDVSVNVHFQPLPLLTAYDKRGYKMEFFPEAYQKYANEISLPVYYDLSDAQVQTVIEAVKSAVKKVLS
jgi:dTDP-4-amino-4,6-dideoxygalactose transaminase